MNRFFSFALFALGFAYGAAAGDLDFTKGVFFVNEDWYGHQNSTVNYLLPDDPERAYWHYRIDQEINPGRELGCTAQYGAIWDGRFYIMAKQAKDPGAEITGGRISVLDASTMEMIRQLEIIDPSGRQCDGRGFVGVSATKAYVSSSNGIWILNLETLDIEGQVEGSANPNVGDDKPNSDPTSSLYFGQTGMMILAGNRVFAVHQQYGLLVVDTETDRVEKVLDMAIVDDAIEADTGVRPSKPSGIGSTIVRAKDGSLWHAAAKNVQGTGATVPYLVRVDPVTLEREVVRIEGTGIYPPSNSWYAWTPDPFCASSVTNRLTGAEARGGGLRRALFSASTSTRAVSNLSLISPLSRIRGSSTGVLSAFIPRPTNYTRRFIISLSTTPTSHAEWMPTETSSAIMP